MFDTEPDPGPNPVTAMLIHQSMAIFAAPCAALLVAIADQTLRLPPAIASPIALACFFAGFPCGLYL
jgi:hypothetical protein